MAINTIKKEKRDFVYLNTYTTPLALYKYLYDNKDKLIVLDDVMGLFNNEKTLALLKSALWEVDGKRLITMNTTSRLLEGYPLIFEFKGQVIFLSNRIKENEHITALLSRTEKYIIDFTRTTPFWI